MIHWFSDTSIQDPVNSCISAEQKAGNQIHAATVLYLYCNFYKQKQYPNVGNSHVSCSSMQECSTVIPRRTRSSADAEGPQDATEIQNIALEKAWNMRMTFKDIQSHYNCWLVDRLHMSITSCQ